VYPPTFAAAVAAAADAAAFAFFVAVDLGILNPGDDFFRLLLGLGFRIQGLGFRV
jgi:hypothetical protein